MERNASTHEAISICFCSAHEDEHLLKQLHRAGLITRWYDRDIQAGSEWESEISSQLNAARVILILVSPDFLASEYCYGVEMRPALDCHRHDPAQYARDILA